MRVLHCVVVWILFGSLLGQCNERQGRTIRFAGEVARGLAFRKDIGHGLDFVLKPLLASQSGDVTGWTIQISPHGPPTDTECKDYLWVVTPPFRFWTHRYLSTEYGKPAQEAVAMSPREFNFVLNCHDYKTERQLVQRVLWPYTYSMEDVDDSLSKLGTTPHGTGHLWILDSKYTPGEKSTDPAKIGVIHWIKFEVDITFPEGQAKNRKP